jgi:subtilase family serine protease
VSATCPDCHILLVEANSPDTDPHVTAVGGTTLKKAAGTTRGWTETTWKGSGSGCSALEPKPAWQHDTACAKRTVADVSALADPATGLGVYDTYNSCGSSRTRPGCTT